jgi:hypothetical protein
MADESDIEDHLRSIGCVRESYAEELLAKMHSCLYVSDSQIKSQEADY